jgi:uncharacterized protein involved in type VI secretion and phage assembly
VDSTPIQFDYLLQADSDFGFVSELAARVGFDWWMDGKTLCFKKPVSGADGPKLTFGQDLWQFSVRATALHPGETTVTGWDPSQKKIVSASASTADPLLPTAALVSGYAKVAALAGSTKLSTAVQTPISQPDAEALAKSATTRWATAAVTARGTTWANASLKLAGSVLVDDAGPANGKYFVTEVEHSYTDQGFETRFAAGDRRPAKLVDTLQSAQASSFRREGLIIGVVTEVGNSQGSPGDVKVKYPGVADDLGSNWARMVSIGGGNNRGMTFMPEVNDEVVVAFENGDPRHPIILGGLFNGKDAQPDFANKNGKVGSRQITSRLGHAVEFGDGDSPADQYISLSLAGKQFSVTLSKEELTAKVPQGMPINITAGSAGIKIAKDGSITIEGNKITLKANTDVEISGLNVTTKASVKSSTSGAMVEVKANATLDMSASGPAMVKGNPVMVN